MDEKYRYPLYPEFSVLWKTAQKNQPCGPSTGFGRNSDRCRRHYLKLSPYHPLELVFGEAVNQFKPIALAQRKVHAVCHQDAFAVQLERFVHVDEYARLQGRKRSSPRKAASAR